MLQKRAEHLRFTLLTSLGLLPMACGAQVERSGASKSDESQTLAPQGGSSLLDASPKAPPAPAETCEGGVPVMDGDVNTGLVTCADGVVHRPVAAECPNQLSRRTTTPIGIPCEPAQSCSAITCRVDADCTAKAYGHCEPEGQVGRLTCKYGCVTDGDCNAGEACVCGPSIGACVKAGCRSADDCGGGYLCAQFYDLFGVGCGEQMQLACQTQADQCRSSRDCSSGAGYEQNCSVADGIWRCIDVPGVVCGRPFLVEGSARLAPVASRRDYSVGLLPRLDGLDAAARTRLTSAWLEIGRMEHASIAAFARFCLQLLELGAPQGLLAAAQRAMADETEHTRLAFSIASHYGGAALGPGSLPMQGALRETRLEDVLQLVVREGCIGETIAALEAAEAAAHAQDAVVRSVLGRIARDEQAHAVLAWRFVAWAVGEQPRLAKVVERVLGAESLGLESGMADRAAHFCAAHAARDNGLLLYGILDDVRRFEVRAAAWRDVVQPCAQRMLAHETEQRPS